MKSPLSYFSELRAPRVERTREHLPEEIKDSFQMPPAAEQTDCERGRVERRRCSVIADLSLVEKAAEWASLQGLVRIEAERCHQPRAQRLNRAIRQHWSIENHLHWALDVSFAEDLDRKRVRNAAQNFSMLNRIALKTAPARQSHQARNQRKRLKAGWDNDYLLQLLGG